jgi:hypothetical protein
MCTHIHQQLMAWVVCQMLCMDLLPSARFSAVSTNEISVRARTLLMRQVRPRPSAQRGRETDRNT